MKTISFYGVSMLLLIATPYCVDAQNRNKTKTDSIAVAQRTQEIRDSLNVIMGKAKAGDADAMNEIGTWYYTGKHVTKDYKQAYEWWKQASLKQNVRAIANLGLCYQLGHGVERDSVDAVRLYVKSIKDGNSSKEDNLAPDACAWPPPLNISATLLIAFSLERRETLNSPFSLSNCPSFNIPRKA